jgi:hypothetical protein
MSTGGKELDPDSRKAVRRHVMLGKNKKKRKKLAVRDGRPDLDFNNLQSRAMAQLPWIPPSEVGRPVGPDLATVMLADSIPASLLENISTSQSKRSFKSIHGQRRHSDSLQCPP